LGDLSSEKENAGFVPVVRGVRKGFLGEKWERAPNPREK